MALVELYAPSPDVRAVAVERPLPASALTIPFLVREAVPTDVPHILRLARLLDSINLPTEEPDLIALIQRSSASFRGRLQNREEGMYLFVLEEAGAHGVVGTAMIFAKHGTPDSPHFYLEMASDQRYSKTLKQLFRHTYLTLRRCLDGPTEVGGLIVDPKHRLHPAKIGKQLSFVRFLYIAIHPERFEDEVLAEMMPPLTEGKESLFWECYGKRVTGLDFREADKLSMKDKEFIDALFPSIPLYVCMFPLEVQKQLGQVGPESQGAAHLLEKIGLRFLRHVDPFDCGPILGAKVNDLVLVQRFRRCHVASSEAHQEKESFKELLMGWEGEYGFRAARIIAHQEQDVLYCSEEVLEALGLEKGTEVGVIPLL
jgi:arginine N-succinyltransferase